MNSHELFTIFPWRRKHEHLRVHDENVLCPFVKTGGRCFKFIVIVTLHPVTAIQTVTDHHREDVGLTIKYFAVRHSMEEEN